MSLALTAALAIPQLASPPAQAPAFDLDGIAYDDANARSVWAVGPDWKAEFTPNGVTFVPFLGSDAPRNFPARFAIDEVTVGGRVVPLAGATEVTRVGDTIRIDHGLVTEVYDCTPEGIEQSFVFERRDHAGEVVVRLDVDTELVGTEDDEGLLLRGAHGGVRYGDAFAFDDAGNEALVSRAFDGESIELTVPAAFPVSSELVLDPLISTWNITGNVESTRKPDVAFEKDMGTRGLYAITYERIFSATDIDSLATFFDPATSSFHTLIIIDVSTDAFMTPRIASSDPLDRFYVVGAVEPAGGGNRSIKGRAIYEGGGTGNLWTVNASSDDCYDPDIGGAREGSVDDGFVAVWTNAISGADKHIHSRYIAWTGVPLGNDIPVGTAGALNITPRISASPGEAIAGQVGRYNVAWVRHLGTAGRRIRGARLSTNGQVARADFPITSAGDSHSPFVSVTSSVPNLGISAYPFLVSFVTEDIADRADSMIAVCDNTGVRSTSNATDMLDINPLWKDTENVVVESVGNRFVLVQSLHHLSSSFNADVFMATFAVTENGPSPGIAFATRHSEISSESVLAQRDVSFASEFAAGGTSIDGFGAWSKVHGFNMLDSTVDGAYLTAAATDAPIGVQYCDAQPNSLGQVAWMAAYGTQATGGSKLLLARELPPQSFAFYLTSMTPGDVLFPGTSRGRLCLGGSIGRFSNQVGPVGGDGSFFMLLDPTQISQPDGAVAAQAGQTWYFQCWHRDTWGGSAASNFSNAVGIRFR